MKLLLVILFSLSSFTSWAQENLSTNSSTIPFCQTTLNTLEKLPILQNGREKPLFVHAQEIFRYVTGFKKPKGMPVVEWYCLMSMQATGLETYIPTQIKIEHSEVRQFLELEKKVKSLDLKTVIAKKDEIRIEAVKIKENNSYKKALSKLFGQIQIAEEILAGKNWLLPAIENNQIQWIPVIEFLFNEKKKQDELAVKNSFEEIYQRVASEYEGLAGKKYLVELFYSKAHLFSYAMLIAILGMFALFIFKNPKIAYSLAGLSAIVQIAAITLRCVISQRAPITNMYETVMFSGFGGLLLSFVIAYLKREKNYVFVGLCLNVLSLMMMMFANNMLTPSISPLVPVLRDNFWLSTHVTTIILSYAAYALSWMLANIVMIKRALGKMDLAEVNRQSDLIYSALKFGTVLISAGIILGGVWADYSWGRFWGWDPKETWSLIVFCIYLAILHGRHTNWINNDRFIPMVAGAFLSVMMAWFGVNYILAAGLHSYGFSEGGAIFLGSFFIIQILLIALCEIIRVKKKTVTY